MVEMPPRHGKSELGSKYLPAWWLGTFPEHNVILTSATDDLALDFSAAARDVIAEHGRDVFGVELRKDVASRNRWQLTSGGMLRAAGIGGSIMGRGANLLICDDYFKNVEEALSETQRKAVAQWFMSTASTRLSPDGIVVIIATRWHRKDLIGKLLEEQEHGGEHYRRIRLPALVGRGESDLLGRGEHDALWPGQFDYDWLQRKRSALVASGYEWMWEALYQQNPPDVLDAEWPPDYFDESIWFDEWPDNIMFRAMAVDPSKGKTELADYSAIVMLGLDPEGVMWVDADLARRDTTRICNETASWYNRFKPQLVAWECNGGQEAMLPQLQLIAQKSGASVPIYEIYQRPGIGKVPRIALGLTPYLARGEFRFKRRSPGARLLVEQMRGFPSTKYRDGPDALEMAVRTIRELHGETETEEVWNREPAY